MRRRAALAVGLVAILAAACSGNTAPSSDVSNTQLPSDSGQAAVSASASQTPSSAPSTSSSAAPSAAPATASPTPKPTPKPTPTPTPVCSSSLLTAKVTGWQGAMGSQIASVKLTNSSSMTCRLRGTPGLQLVDAAGHVLLDSTTAGASGKPHVSPGDKTWTLLHGGWVTTEVQVSNYCGATNPVLPTTIAFLLPSNGGRLVAASNPSGGAPPCYGNPGDQGSIAMNGWAH